MPPEPLDDARRLARRVEELEESVRILQAENQRLAASAEDTLLLSLIAEEINPAEHAEQVLARGLERISILKDIPYAACCLSRDDGMVLLASFYQYGSDRDESLDLWLPPELIDEARSGPIHLTAPECGRIRLPVRLNGQPLQPRSTLIIPASAGADMELVYVFADDRTDDRLSRLSVVLHRAIEMMASRIEILDLLDTQRKLNAELNHANDALRAATQAKSDFLANMTHEIRTPMNAILGFAQLMRRDPGLTDEQRERLNIINRSGEHLLTLINDVLEMSKIEAGGSTFAPSTFALRPLLEDLAAVFRDQAAGKGVAFTTSVAENLPPAITTDQGKLRQVLVNLLGNAVKFTDRGSIELRASWRPLDAPTVLLTFEVADTGVGIAPDEMGVLFTKFGQTASGRAVTGGTGLGLAISREYAELLGGRIEAESEPGSGSTFRFEVPAETDAIPDVVPAARAEAVGLAADQRRPRILVADDYAEMRLLIAQMLEEVGFEVVTANDGTEAFELFTSTAPDVLLLDMRMPGADGRAVISAVRGVPGGANARIVAMTANAFVETRDALLSIGADAFLSKPFSREELLDALHEVLGVEYEYDMPGPCALSGGRAVPIPTEAARVAPWSLPEDLTERIAAAATRADFDAVIELAAECEGIDPAAALELTRMAGEFDAAGILARLDPTGD